MMKVRALIAQPLFGHRSTFGLCVNSGSVLRRCYFYSRYRSPVVRIPLVAGGRNTGRHCIRQPLSLPAASLPVVCRALGFGCFDATALGTVAACGRETTYPGLSRQEEKVRQPRATLPLPNGLDFSKLNEPRYSNGIGENAPVRNAAPHRF